MLVAANSELPWPVVANLTQGRFVPPLILWFFLLSAMSRALLPRPVREETHFLSSFLSLADFGKRGVLSSKQESWRLYGSVFPPRGVSLCLF